MSNRFIIGIIGKKKTGKDKITDIFVKSFNYKKISFADPLKEGCCHIFGLTEDQVYKDEKDVVDEYWKVTPRKLLQFVGTELFRNQLHKVIPNLGRSIWVKCLEKKILDNPDTNFVINNIRFQEELDMLKKYNSFIFKVHRPNASNKDEHISENVIDYIERYDKLIINDSTIEKLNEKIISTILNIKNFNFQI